MDRIQKVSAYLLIIFNLLLIVLPLLDILQWLFVESEIVRTLMANGNLTTAIKTPTGFVNLSTIQWTPLSKVIGLSGEILGLLPLLLGLFVLKLVFRNYQKGEIFTIRNAKYYQYLGWLFFLNALLAKPLSDMFEVLAVTLSNPPGHRYISIGFGTPNMEALFCGVLVLVISWVMLEASKLQEEQKFVI